MKKLVGRDNNCKGCFYYKFLEPGVRACHYILIEGVPRPCPVDKCSVKLILSKEEKDERNKKYYNKCYENLPTFKSDKSGQ